MVEDREQQQERRHCPEDPRGPCGGCLPILLTVDVPEGLPISGSAHHDCVIPAGTEINHSDPLESHSETCSAEWCLATCLVGPIGPGPDEAVDGGGTRAS